MNGSFIRQGSQQHAERKKLKKLSNRQSSPDKRSLFRLAFIANFMRESNLLVV